MMRQLLSRALSRLAAWLAPASVPPLLGGMPAAMARHRAPGGSELLAELKHTAWACASLNAAACASFPPRLYVTTRPGEAPPRARTRAVAPATLDRLRLSPHTRGAERVEEVHDHPLLDLLAQVNPAHNAFELWTNT